MKYLSHIVNILDTALEGQFSFLRPDKRKVMGIASIVRRDNVEEGQFDAWPGKWDGSEYQYAGVDDDYDLITYHRKLGIKVSQVIGKSYGSEVARTRNAANMCMVIFGRADILKHTNDEVALHIQAMLPQILSKAQSQELENITTTINVTDIVLNEEQVFNEEYRRVKYFITPEHVYLKINYTIESIFGEKCFNTCSCKSATPNS